MQSTRWFGARSFGIGLALLAVACPAPSVPCAPPLVSADPAGGAEYSVAQQEWMQDDHPVAVTYPATSSGSPGGLILGSDVPFAAGLTNAPVVILLHGNGGGGGSATYRGYSYLQGALARHGITAVSVGGGPGGTTADESVVRAVMYQLLAAPFRWKLNLQNIGMMGHSAGGTTVKNIAAAPPPGMTVRAVLMLGTAGGDGARFPTVDGYMTLLPAAEGVGTCEPGTSDPTCRGTPGYPDVPGAIEFDTKRATPFNVQLYVHRANHYSWNRESRSRDAAGAAVPPVFSPKHHELVLRSYATAFFRAILQDMPREPLEQQAFFRSQDGPVAYLNGHRLPSLISAASPSTGVYGETTVDTADLVLAWRSRYLTTVDDYQQTNGVGINSLGEAATSGLVMEEQDCAAGCKYAGRTRLLFLSASCASGAATCPDASYRTELGATRRNLRSRAAVLVRAGEPLEQGAFLPAVPARGVSFALGVEDASGMIQWKNADEVGGVPRPYARNDLQGRWVLKTLRFPIDCFSDVDTSSVVALHLRLVGTDPGRQVAFDDLALE